MKVRFTNKQTGESHVINGAKNAKRAKEQVRKLVEARGEKYVAKEWERD